MWAEEAGEFSLAFLTFANLISDAWILLQVHKLNGSGLLPRLENFASSNMYDFILCEPCKPPFHSLMFCDVNKCDMNSLLPRYCVHSSYSGHNKIDKYTKE